MTTPTSAALAQLSLAAYADTPAGATAPLPTGFTTLDAASLPIDLEAGESFSGGVFRNANAAALATEATLDGQETLVIAFRGRDDAADTLSLLQDVNADYPLFASLVEAVDAAAASGRYEQVLVTGHSLGGSFAQLFMATHADQPGTIRYEADTFGSIGALLPGRDDARVTNFVIADDPAPVLAAHRADAGDLLRSDERLASLAADRVVEEIPGLTREQVLATFGSLTADYDNPGDTIVLPGRSEDLSPAANIAGLARLDAGQHAAQLYASTVATATPATTVLVPEAPQPDPNLTVLRGLYNSDQDDPQAIRTLLEEWGQTLGEDIQAELNDAFTSLRADLAGLGRDLDLF